MRLFFILTVTLLILGCGDKAATPSERNVKVKDSVSVMKSDLLRIPWIIGNWKGMYEGKSFYENYHLVSDTVLEITSYELKGNDTSKSSFSYLHWKDGFYYLGDSLNWKVISLTDREIYMEPNFGATNDITWTFQDSTTWVAVLKTPGSMHTYIMERQPPIDSLLKTKKK